MLWTMAIILVIMWLLGMITSYTLGGFLHLSSNIFHYRACGLYRRSEAAE